MIEVTFELNGRKVRPEDIGDALERAVLNGVRDSILEKLQDVRDPETGAPPKVLLKGTSLDNLSVEIEGTPNQIEEVKRRLQ